MKLIGYSLILIFVTLCGAEELVSYDQIKYLIGKHVRGEVLSNTDMAKFHQLSELLAMPNYVLRDAIESYSIPRLTLTCVACRATFSTVIEALQENQSDEELTQSITDLCVRLGINNEKVCSGVISLNMPIIIYIIKNQPAATAEIFCGLLFQTISIDSCPFVDERFEFTLELPEKSDLDQVAHQTSESFKVAFISDAHIDPMYEAFGVGNCDEPTCCRYGQNPATRDYYKVQFNDSRVEQSMRRSLDGDVMLDLDFAEEMRTIKSSGRSASPRQDAVAGYWGDYRSCDTPLWAFDNIIEQIAQNHKDIDAVYYTGDTIDHGVWETTYDLINEMNYHVTDKFLQEFGNIPVYGVIANHESQPMNQYAPSYVTEEGLSTQWLYDSLADQWSQWLTPEAEQTLRFGGYYSTLLKPGLRVIVLNNNVAYKYNWWLVYDPQDSKIQLDWLVETLLLAENNGEKVHILSHIPPGVSDLTKTWTREYARIVSRFSSTITGEFNGHTHNDEFKVFYSSEDDEPIVVAWNGGAMTSYSNYNVNYKIMSVDGETYAPTDFDTWIYNLTEANLTPNQKPHWFLEYNFKNTYGLTDLTPKSLSDLVYRMVTTEKHLLDKYIAFFGKMGDSFLQNGCNTQCTLGHLCKTVVTDLWEREKCEEITNLYYGS